MEVPGQTIAANDATPASPQERPRKRVLLVEDEGLVRAFLLCHLSRAGLQVDFATNVPAGLEKLHLHPPDAVLMELPRCTRRDQPSIIREVCLNPQFANRPIYVYTRRVAEGSRGWRALNQLGTIPFSKSSTPLENVVSRIVSDLTGPFPGFPARERKPVQADWSKPLPAPKGTNGESASRGATSADQGRTLTKTESRDSQGAKGPAPREQPAADIAAAAPASADYCVGQAAVDQPSADTALPAEACAPATASECLPVEVIEQALLEIAQETTTAEPDAMPAAQVAQRDAGVATTLPNAEMAPALGGAGQFEQDYLPESSPADPLAPPPVSSQASSSIDPMNTPYQVENADRPVSHAVQPRLSAAAPAASLPGRDAGLESCLGPVVVIDQNGLIAAADPLCAEVFQREPAEVVGQPLEVLLKAGADGIRRRLFEAPAPRGPGAQAYPLLFALARRKDGADFPVSITVQAEPAGLEGCWALTFHDMNQSPAAPTQSPPIRSFDEPCSPWPTGAQVAAPLTLEEVPEIFHRAPAEPAAQPVAPGFAAAEVPGPAAASDMSQAQPGTVAGGNASPEGQPPMNLAAEAMPEPSDQPQPRAESEDVVQLERRLAQTSDELERTQADLQQRFEQFETVSKAAQASVAALKDKSARCAELEEQLAQARQTAGQLQAELSTEQEVRAMSEQGLQELQQRLANNVEDLNRAQADLKQQTDQLSATRAASQQAEAALEQETARCAQLEAQLAQSAEELKLAQAKSQAPAAPEPVESETALQAQVLELETRLRAGVVSLAHVTAELETERGERQRAEQRAAALAAQLEGLHEELKTRLETEQFDQQRIAELGEQLRQREENLAQANTALQKEAADRQLAEGQLRAMAELQERLETNPAPVEEARQAFLRSQQDVENQLQTRLRSVAEVEARLEQEAAERQRQALEAIERQHREQMQERELALARLQSALHLEECERKRLEAELLHSRYLASDSARTGRALVNGLRRQMQSPVESLHQSARRLLQFHLPEDQKGLIQSMLENVLLLHTSLQEAPDNSGAVAQPATLPTQPATPGPGGEKA